MCEGVALVLLVDPHLCCVHDDSTLTYGSTTFSLLHLALYVDPLTRYMGDGIEKSLVDFTCTTDHQVPTHTNNFHINFS